MSIQRFILASLMGCLAMTMLASASNKTDLIIGHRAIGDSLIQTILVEKESSWLGGVKEVKTFSGDGISKITQIQAINLDNDDSSADVVLTNGGPDSTFATLQFKSKWRHGINYLVEIYGKP